MKQKLQSLQRTKIKSLIQEVFQLIAMVNRYQKKIKIPLIQILIINKTENSLMPQRIIKPANKSKLI